MSVQALTSALAIQGLSSTEKLLLLVLANYADEDNKCWPSEARLSRDTCLSKRAIINTLQRLEGRGVLTREERGRRSDGTRNTTLTRLMLHGAPDAPRPPQHSAPDDTNMVHVVPNHGARGAPKPSIEPSKKEPSEESLSGMTDAKLDELFALWWEAYPKKVDRREARKVFGQLLRSGQASFEELMSGAQWYRAQRENEDAKYTKGPAAWLRAGKWSDERVAPAPAAPTRRGQDNGLSWALEGLQ